MALKVFFEGDLALRKGIKEFFGKMTPPEVVIEPIACKNKPVARFLESMAEYPDDDCLLLMDGHKVAGTDRYRNENLIALLQEKTNDGRIKEASPSHLHFMVIEMEAWFLADREAMVTFYGDTLRESSLPKSNSVESLSRDKIWQAIRESTVNSVKGEYHKTRHGGELLGLLDPERVAARAWHCRVLKDALQTLYHS